MQALLICAGTRKNDLIFDCTKNDKVPCLRRAQVKSSSCEALQASLRCQMVSPAASLYSLFPMIGLDGVHATVLQALLCTLHSTNAVLHVGRIGDMADTCQASMCCLAKQDAPPQKWRPFRLPLKAQGANTPTKDKQADVRDHLGSMLKLRCQVAHPMQEFPVAPKKKLPRKSSASSRRMRPLVVSSCISNAMTAWFQRSTSSPTMKVVRLSWPWKACSWTNDPQTGHRMFGGCPAAAVDFRTSPSISLMP